MAVVLDAVDGGTSSTSTITSAGASPNGSDRLMLACATGRSAADDLKTGGSGGTSLTKLSTDVSLFFDTWFGNVWSIHEGPTGSTTGWVDFGSGTASAFSIVYLEGVDQTTPRTTAQTAGPTTSSTPSLAFTGLGAGQVVYAAIVAGNLPTAITGFTENGSSTEVRADYSAVDGERQSVTIWLSGTADGSGAVTLGGTFTGGVDVCDWYMYGFGINASSSGPTYTLAADGGTYSLSGTSNVLTAGRAISAEAGSFTLTGANATLTAGRTIAADGGSYVLTGQDAALAVARVLVADGGTYSLTGQDATLTYTPVSSYELAAEGGSFTYSGADAALVVSRVLSASASAFTYSGGDAEFAYSGAPVVAAGGGGGRRGKQKQRYKITQQLPVQQEPEELPGEEVEYLEPSIALPVDQFGDEVDGRIILANADIDALGAELDKRQAMLKQQIQDFEDILTYL